jgi:hypothetical protein
LSTTPATPLPSQKPLNVSGGKDSPISRESFDPSKVENARIELEKINSPEPKVLPPESKVTSPEPKIASPEPKTDVTAPVIAVSTSSYSSTEQLIPKVEDTPRSPSPTCLRPAIKIDDVKTIKRNQTKSGWL